MSTDISIIASLKTAIVAELQGNRALTFSHLEKLPGARGRHHISREIPDSNATVVLWKNVSSELVRALKELEGERRIAAVETSAHHYFQQGSGLSLEEARPQKLSLKTKRRRIYWLPVAFKAYSRVADWERVTLDAAETAPTISAVRS